MNYPLTSIAEIVGRVLRRTGLKDTSLIADLNEWIVEAMQLLQTSMELHPDYKDLEVSFHKAKYPCGLAELWAVEHCGCRLPFNNGEKDARKFKSLSSVSHGIEDNTYIAYITGTQTPNANQIYGSLAMKIDSLPWNTKDWYKTDGRHILTSFEDGQITLYFGSMHVDEQGFLMVPDEGNYKEALTCFLRSCISSRMGDQREEEKWHERFEKHVGRAIEAITYPSVDKMQATTEVLTRLLPDLSYYDRFSTTI